ncbi:sensor histidine kinase [Raineya orbicola]|uniref:Histidine kinase n=1 Tax=Raineya orbicola TaxID=2016530 RepID=A0A2N3IG88_9BACT|nr:histidine kinase [Raineya orbicola]PKQ69325.1 Histidine kinase [Raineya orbicola]
MRKIVYLIILLIATIRVFVIEFLIKLPITAWEHFLIWSVGMLVMALIFEWIYVVHRFLNKKLPFEEKITLRLFVQVIFSLLGTLLLTYIGINFLMPHLIKSLPTHQYNTPMSYLQVVLLTFGINMGFFGEYFFRAWKQKIIEAERLAKENAMMQKAYTQTQFANLQNQLNPHFLFNSIASLSSLIYENQDLAAKFLEHLAKVYRYVLQNKEQNLVSLQTELDFIGNYLFLLQTRFDKALQISFRVDNEALSKQIVPVTLQILLENAVKHNIMTEAKPLQIHIFNTEDYLLVENNLQKKSVVEHSNKLGLSHLKNLYTFLSPLPLCIEENENAFSVKIPLL